MFFAKSIRHHHSDAPSRTVMSAGAVTRCLLPRVLALTVLGSGFASADEVWVQVDEWRNPNPVFGDEFGATVAFGDELAIVGAPYKTVDGREDSGMVYVWEMATGRLVRRLEQPPVGSGTRFGRAMAMQGRTGYIDNASGDIIYVLNVLSGALLFTIQPDASEYVGFGSDLEVEGELLLVGAPDYDLGGRLGGCAYVYDAGTGAERLQLFGTGVGSLYDDFGRAVDIDGQTGIIGASSIRGNPESGAAFVFDLVSGDELLKLIDPGGEYGDDFGDAVALGGGYAVVGAPLDDVETVDRAGSAHVFDATTGAYLHMLQEGTLRPTSKFGQCVAVHDNIACIGSLDGPDELGLVWVADLGTGHFTQVVPIDDRNFYDEFGQAIAFDGETLLVGAPRRARVGRAALFSKRPRVIGIAQAGTCPGPLRIEVSNLAPNTTATLVASRQGGSYYTDPGLCSTGLLLFIEPPFVGGTPRSIHADANGFASVAVTIPGPACGGLYVQVIDTTQCEVSEALAIQ